MMKKTLLSFSLLLSSFCYANAQTTRVNFMHNSSDQSLMSLDIYINGVLAVHHLNYHFSNPTVNVPAMFPVNIGIALGGSGTVNDTFYNLNTTLLPSNAYTMVLNGIESTSGYSPLTPFRIDVFNQAREISNFPTNTDILFINGSTDAPILDVRSGITTLADNIAFGNYSSDYISFPSSDTLFRLTNSTGANTIRTLNAPFNTLNYDGKAGVLLTSGFMDPSANSNGPAFGVWLAPASGGPFVRLVSTDGEDIARTQFINNCADTVADTVDIYMDGKLVADDLRFRTATPFMDMFAQIPVTFDIAPRNSTSNADAFYTQTLTPDSAGKYIFVANGIQSAVGYNPKPAYTLHTYNQARETATNSSNTDVLFIHGSTDAPALSISEGGNTLFASTAYGNFSSSGYQSAATKNSIYRVPQTNGDVDYEANFQVLSWYGDAVTLLASGFADTAANNKGPKMGLYAVTGRGGAFVKLPVTTVGIKEAVNTVQFSVYPNPANNTVYVSGLGAAEATIEVIDMNGKVVATSGSRSVNIAQLPASMYIIKVSTDKATGFKTFVKE